MALPKVTAADAGEGARAKINTAIDEADKVAAIEGDVAQHETRLDNHATQLEQKASQAALDALSVTVDGEFDAVRDDLTELSDTVDGKLDKAAAQSVRGRDGGLYPYTRPGDGPWYFTRAISVQEPSAYNSLDDTSIVDSVDGRAYQLIEDGYVASKQFFPVHPGEVYRYLAEFRRLARSDPSDDAIRASLLCYDKNRARIGNITVEQFLTPTLNQLYRVEAFFGLDPAEGTSVVALPAGTASIRPNLRAFGGTQQTNILRLLSEQNVLGEQEAAILEIGQRADEVEALVQSLNGKILEGDDEKWTFQDREEETGRRRFGISNNAFEAPTVALRYSQGAVELRGPGYVKALRAMIALDARWAWAIVDEHNRVHFGKRTDGTFYPDLGSGQAGALPVMLNRGALRQFAYARGRLGRGLSGKMRIGFLGDSFIASGYRWLAGVLYGTASLYGRFGDAGAGWFSFVTGKGRPNTGWYVLRRKLASGTDGNAGLQDTDAYWTVARRNAGNVGPDISSVTPLQASTETDGMFTLTSPADSVALSSFKLVYKAAAACSVRYRWNGGSGTTLALNTSGGPTAVELTGNPSSPGWTFDLQAVSGATELYGLMLDGPASGANVSVLGVNGASTSDWINNDAATWRQAIGLLGIKTYFLMLGTNDQGIPNSPATYIANIQETVARLRTADPACDICILVPPENFDPTRITTPMAGYETAVRDYCASNKTIAALLMQSCCGLPGGDYSAAGAFPLWDADTVHPDPNTGGVVMSTFFNTEAVR